MTDISNRVYTANILNRENKIKANVTNVPSATTEVKGIIKIATEEEAREGTSNNTAITPLTLKICNDTYTFEQGIASDVWEIEHNLNKFPSAFAVDSAGFMQMPNEIEYNNENKITLYFLSPFSGKAYLN